MLDAAGGSAMFRGGPTFSLREGPHHMSDQNVDRLPPGAPYNEAAQLAWAALQRYTGWLGRDRPSNNARAAMASSCGSNSSRSRSVMSACSAAYSVAQSRGI